MDSISIVVITGVLIPQPSVDSATMRVRTISFRCFASREKAGSSVHPEFNEGPWACQVEQQEEKRNMADPSGRFRRQPRWQFKQWGYPVKHRGFSRELVDWHRRQPLDIRRLATFCSRVRIV